MDAATTSGAPVTMSASRAEIAKANQPKAETQSVLIERDPQGPGYIATCTKTDGTSEGPQPMASFDEALHYTAQEFDEAAPAAAGASDADADMTSAAPPSGPAAPQTAPVARGPKGARPTMGDADRYRTDSYEANG